MIIKLNSICNLNSPLPCNNVFRVSGDSDMNIFVRSLFCLPWMILINFQFSNDCFWLFCIALPLIFWSEGFQRFSVILEIPPLYDEFLRWNAREKWEWVNWKKANSIAESHSHFFFFFLPQHVARGASLIRDRVCTPLTLHSGRWESQPLDHLGSPPSTQF